MSSWSRKVTSKPGTKTGRLTLAYTALSLVPVAAVAVMLRYLLGKGGLPLAGLLALPWLAWRYDNRTGTFLPLSVLVVFLFIILGLLVFLMAVVLKGAG
jgi:hypothetical protein